MSRKQKDKKVFSACQRMEDLEEVVVQRHFRLRVEPSRNRDPVLKSFRVFLARKKRLDQAEFDVFEADSSRVNQPGFWLQNYGGIFCFFGEALKNQNSKKIN